MNNNVKHFLLDFIKKFKYSILISYGMSILADVCYLLVGGYVLQIIFNKVNNNNYDIFCLCIFYSLLITNYPLWEIINKSIEYIVRKRLDKYYVFTYFAKLLKYDIEYFSNNLTGQLTTKFFNLQKKTEHIFIWFVQVITNFLVYIVGIIIFSFIDIKLFILNIAWFIIYAISMTFLLKWQFKVSNENSEQKTKSFGIINDCFTNIMNIKIFSNEKREYKKIKKQSLNILKSENQIVLNKNILNLFNYIMMGTIIFGSTGITFYNYMVGNISAGVIIFVINFTLAIVYWLNFAITILFDIISSISSIDNSLNLLITKIKIKNKDQAKQISVNDGKIVFKNVYFSYHE